MTFISQNLRAYDSALPASQEVLEARRLTKHFRGSRRFFGLGHAQVVQAVNGVDFVLRQQQTLSIVGESGCGKTTTAKILLDLERPTDGSVLFRGKPLSEIKDKKAYAEYRLAVQAVFQDSSSALSPRRRICKIVGEPLVVAGMRSDTALEDHVRSLLTKVGLDPAIGNSFPHELSGGMRQRVAIAQALATNPSVIILDEPVSALDVSVRAQILNLLKDVQQRFGVAYVLISHDLATVRYLSHNVAAMYLGEVVEQASAEAFFTESLHPYTLALISAAIPTNSATGRDRIVLTGDLPSPANPPSGCRFHTRCWLRKRLGNPSACVTERPQLKAVGVDHKVACHFTEASSQSEVRNGILGQIISNRPSSAAMPVARSAIL